jgi:hypothetical protein
MRAQKVVEAQRVVSPQVTAVPQNSQKGAAPRSTGIATPRKRASTGTARAMGAEAGAKAFKQAVLPNARAQKGLDIAKAKGGKVRY